MRLHPGSLAHPNRNKGMRFWFQPKAEERATDYTAAIAAGLQALAEQPPGQGRCLGRLGNLRKASLPTPFLVSRVKRGHHCPFGSCIKAPGTC